MKTQIKFTNKKDAGRLAFIEGHSVPASFPEFADGPLSFSGRDEMSKYFEILAEKNYEPDTIEQLDKGEALWGCDKKPDEAWLLSDRDVWYANPSYEGLPVPHPQDSIYVEDIVAYQINEAVAFFREVTYVPEKIDYGNVPF